MIELLKQLMALVAIFGKWLKIQDLIDLFKAASALPSDPCEQILVANYLHGVADPLSKVISAVAKQFHKHEVTAINEHEVRRVLSVELEKAGVDGWEQYIDLLLPLVLKVIEWFRNRKKAEPTPGPNPVNI